MRCYRVERIREWEDELMIELVNDGMSQLKFEMMSG